MKKIKKAQEIKLRVLDEANLYLSKYLSFRDIAKIKNVSKSTVGIDLKYRLKDYDILLDKRIKDLVKIKKSTKK